MSSATVNFAYPVKDYLTQALLVVCLIIEVWAFISCASQRAAAFPAVGTLPKGAWLAIIGGATLLSALSFGVASIVGLIAIAAAAIYLLDVRPAIKDVVDGHGPW